MDLNDDYMDLRDEIVENSTVNSPEQKSRMGIFKGKYIILKDLNKHFDDDNEEIWSGLFERGNL